MEVDYDYKNIEENELEVVERKSFGHPDNLADNLAKLCSIEYSKYCLSKFGCILHHNFDKLYIGAGKFEQKKSFIKIKSKIKIVINGRVSICFAKEKINLKRILQPAIKEYISCVLPAINFEKDVKVIYNANSFSQRKNWYTPKSIEDIPDAKEITSGDTSVCVVHTGQTPCEEICKAIESLFFKRNKKGIAIPIYNNIGQDIKIMITRIGQKIEITMCIPVFVLSFSTYEEYCSIIKYYEKIVFECVDKLCKKYNYNFSIYINKKSDSTYRIYKTYKGSCIDCGEEGVVGRGNNSRGLISVFREHSMEAPFGKNERYHTGRVLDFLCRKLGERILQEFNAKTRIVCVARNQNSLLEPYLFNISLNKKISKLELESLKDKVFNEKFLMENILQDDISI